MPGMVEWFILADIIIGLLILAYRKWRRSKRAD
jgi:hypothetical protein